MQDSDLTVDRCSDALEGVVLDVVVTGSVGAVEAVRFIRALRRLGAEVFPWLTEGGARLITPMSLEWAAAHPVTESFSGTASHIAIHDACVVAPASADFIGRVASGLANVPAAALVMSYLGQKKPVIVLPNMHDSLLNAPKVQENIEAFKKWGVTILQGRREEGKCKFPHPAILADEVAHLLNTNRLKLRVKKELHYSEPTVLLTMGGTRGYWDDVRFIGNYSSGALGSLVAEELFRSGFCVWVIAGPCEVLPRTYTHLERIETNQEMEDAMDRAVQEIPEGQLFGAVYAAAVLDFVPAQKVAGKIKSEKNGVGSSAGHSINLVPTKKIIGSVLVPAKIKVGFKLESSISAGEAEAIAKTYMQRYQLSLMIVNAKSDVDRHRHKAYLFEKISDHVSGELLSEPKVLLSKPDVAAGIADYIKRSLVELPH